MPVPPGERVVVAATAEPGLAPSGAGGARGLGQAHGGGAPAAGAAGVGDGGSAGVTARAGEPSGPQGYHPPAEADATGKQRQGQQQYVQQGGPLSSSPGASTAAATPPTGAAAATRTPGPGHTTNTITVQPGAAAAAAAVGADPTAGKGGDGDVGSGSAHLAVVTAPEHALPQMQGSSSDRSPHHHTGYLSTLNVQPKQGEQERMNLGAPCAPCLACRGSLMHLFMDDCEPSRFTNTMRLISGSRLLFVRVRT